MAKKKSKSSDRWLNEHFTDEYVKRSKIDGYRSRASYKLLELNKRDKFLKSGMTVIDLGAAPGGWSQIAANQVGKKGRVIALDLLPIDPIAGVEFLQGDFQEEKVLEELLDLLGQDPVDLLLSDMAPNMSGVDAVDIPRSYYLAELALDLAQQTLKQGGDLVVKLFHGDGFEQYMQQARKQFKKVYTRKPDASRSRSREVYLLAKGKL